MGSPRFKPAAFMSYVHEDDEYGKLSKLREYLENEIEALTGDPFEIFQDKENIGWGDCWKERIKQSLNDVTFFIPVLTPRFFKSEHCRFELETFLDREKRLKRNDLILPIYYIDVPFLDNKGQRTKDKLAEEIANRQYSDWRELRNLGFQSEDFVSRPESESRSVWEMVRKQAREIREALAKVAIIKQPDDLNVKEGTSAIFSIEAIGENLSYKWQQCSKSETTFSDIDGANSSDYSIPHSTLADNGRKYRVVVENERSSVTSKVAILTLLREPEPETTSMELVVDPMHKGRITTIGEAIKLGKPGSKIFVRPGIYDEGLIIDKPLEIIGDGHAADIIIRASGVSVVQFKTNMGSISGITFQQLSEGSWHCIDIYQGRLELKNCDITSHSGACIAIHGNSEPYIHDNDLHDGKDVGILISQSAHGTVEDNRIFRNALSGILIKDNCNPIIRRNVIHSCMQTGISILKTGRGTIQDNDIFRNVSAGVEISDGGTPIVRHNQIHDGMSTGISVSNACGNIEDNDIYGNTLAEVEIKNSGNPYIRQNRIFDGKGIGISVFEGGKGIIEKNEIYGHARANIAIASNGNPLMSSNRIHDGKDCGVLVSDGGEGSIEENDIFGNAFPGVEIREFGNPSLRRNHIYDGKDTGIFIHNRGGGIIEMNEIFNNSYAGIAISGQSNPKIKYNKIHDGKVTGILIYKSGIGEIEDNDIFSNSSAGIEISEEGNPLVYRNRIFDGKDNGILITRRGLGSIKDNDIMNNAHAGVEIREFSNPVLRNNRINKNLQSGVYIHHNGGGILEGNDLTDNKNCGWDLQGWDNPDPNAPKIVMIKNKI